jgi:hypothetical protein
VQQLVEEDGGHGADGGVGAGSYGRTGDGGRARLLGDGGGQRRNCHHALRCDALRQRGVAGPDQHRPFAASFGCWRLPRQSCRQSTLTWKKTGISLTL